ILVGHAAADEMVSGAGDQAAGAVGSEITREGLVSVTVGTSGVVFAASESYRADPEGRLHAFCHAVPGQWHLMGVMLSAAGSLRWYREQFALETSYDDLLAPAAEVAPGSEGLVFLPYLTGERTPHADPDARGAFVGLTLRHERAHLTRAVLVAEDAAFWGHHGFDPAELRVALEEAWRERRAPRGASTLTMQLARNLWLSPETTLWRKLREAILARRLETTLDKRRILELYLSVVELGPGVFGVQAASRAYWGVPVERMGPLQAVELAATLPSPLRNNPGTRTRAFRWRRDLIAARVQADTLEDVRAADPAIPGDTVEPGAEPRLPSRDTVPVPTGEERDTAATDTTVRDTADAESDTARADTVEADTIVEEALPDTVEAATCPTAAPPRDGARQAPGEASAAGSTSGAGWKKGAHFSFGDGSVSRLTTTSRVIDTSTLGMTM
ncbi:MAG: transglycosylase domain-containing protein, partial [Gemmatimonadota bacterium]